jgi:Flp pilus assembly protein TadB
MSIVGDVAKELLAMFLADFRLTISVLILAAIVAILVDWIHLNPLVGGALLVLGSLLILVEAVTREAKRSES